MRQYSPFWAILMVLVAMLLIHGIQTKTLFQQEKQLKTVLKQSEPALTQAQTINAVMLNIGRDLTQMAYSSVGAQQIVNDFQIRFDNPNASGRTTNNPSKPTASQK